MDVEKGDAFLALLSCFSLLEHDYGELDSAALVTLVAGVEFGQLCSGHLISQGIP